jgi:hypothetical protein
MRIEDRRASISPRRSHHILPGQSGHVKCTGQASRASVPQENLHSADGQPGCLLRDSQFRFRELMIHLVKTR